MATSNTLSSAEIAQMRSDYEAIGLPDTCIILSGTVAADGQGGGTITWGTTTTGVKCRLDYVSPSFQGGQESIAAGALQSFPSYFLAMPYNTAITTANRVEYGGATYNVSEVNSGKSWQLFLYARLEKV